MTLHDFLLSQHEACPAWLEGHKKGDPFRRDDFFSSRIVYYPGAGSDGHAVKAFGSAHAAHSFVHVDYMLTKAEILRNLTGGRPLRYDSPFLGYGVLDLMDLEESDLSPHGWKPHVSPNTAHSPGRGFTPFGFLAVLERDHGHDEAHGPSRLAILFLGADGHATYDALFCQDGRHPLFAVLLQDHGFGGNYDRFGQGGLLEKIALKARVWPDWLLVGDNTKAWNGYEGVQDVDGDVGGMHSNLRRLFRRTSRP